MTIITRVLLFGRARIAATREVGEGVISAAIAVLIMAFIGALMWVGFKAIWEDAEQQTSEQIQQIGS
jgi:hypothetical protein